MGKYPGSSEGAIAPARSVAFDCWVSHCMLGNTTFCIPPMVLAPVPSGRDRAPLLPPPVVGNLYSFLRVQETII